MADLVVRVLIPSSVSANEDTISNSFCVSTATAPSSGDYTAISSNVVQFYSSLSGAQVTPIWDYLSGDLSTVTNASTVNIYDVSAALSGGPAGSPVFTNTFTWGAVTTGSTNLDPRMAMCVAIRADYGVALEHGASISLPSDDRAVDEGAPTTHTGLARPRARFRGRLYLGPLNSFAVTQSHTQEIVWQSQFALDVPAALHGLKTRLAGLTNVSTWSVWSRRDSIFRPVLDYFLDESPSTQRRRGDVSRFRVHNWSTV